MNLNLRNIARKYPSNLVRFARGFTFHTCLPGTVFLYNSSNVFPVCLDMILARVSQVLKIPLLM